MNNGVNNTNQENNQLAPMAGVKIAPAEEKPVDASKASAPDAVAQGPTITKTIPVAATPATQQPIPQQVPQPQPQPQQPVVMQQPQATNVTPPPVQPIPPQQTPQQPINPTKKSKLTPILLAGIIGLGIMLFITNTSHNQQIAQLKYNCTPIGSTNEEKELNVESTIVKNLYSKVATTIREDLAQPEFNDQMKLYLAYRQIMDNDKYESNCIGFNPSIMEPYTCDANNKSWRPNAFREEVIQLKIKELFGENTNIPLQNIQLGNTCYIGYQYIKERGEFVEGTCNNKTATSFKANKSIVKAISTRNMIILTEEVKYVESEGMELPHTLKSGTYKYVFRLDMNYNYVLVSKTYESKYE